MKKHLALLTATMAAMSAGLPLVAAAQSSRITVARHAPITALAFAGASASVSVNTAEGSPPPGRRTVVLARPVTAVSLPGWESHIRIASR